MIRSKDIKDYFDVDFAMIRPFVEIPFDIHLFFEINKHVLVWVKSGTAPTNQFISDYQKRGVGKIWIHSSDRKVYLDYIQQMSAAEQMNQSVDDGKRISDPMNLAADLKQPALTPNTALPEPETPATPAVPPPDAKELIDLANNESLPEEERKKQVAEKVEDLLKETFGQNDDPLATPPSDEERKKNARDLVKNFIAPPDEVPQAARDLIDQVWEAAQENRELEHSANVGTVAVLLAMSFGNIQRKEMWELATAGLLHDLGLGQLEHKHASLYWSELTDPTLAAAYESHVMLSQTLIKDLAPSLSERVLMIVQQHHERFDGSGYPNHVKAFDINDFAQLISVADLVDSMCSGRWDGKERGLREAIDTLKALEKSGTFPHQFNPEVLRGCMKALSQKDVLVLKEAQSMINSLTEEMTNNKRQDR